jgi:hypothetical protein
MTPTSKGKTYSTRLDSAERDELDEMTRLLGTTDTETFKYGLRALMKELDLLRLDSLALQDRIARTDGDDAVVTFTIADLEHSAVRVSVGGEDVPDIEAAVLHATVQFGQRVLPPTEGMIVAKDLQTGLYYSIGVVPLEKGATIEIPLKRLPDLVQDDEDLTPEQKRAHIRANARIRRAVRAARGEPDEADNLETKDEEAAAGRDD